MIGHDIHCMQDMVSRRGHVGCDTYYITRRPGDLKHYISKDTRITKTAVGVVDA